MTAIDMNFSLILPEIALALFAMAALMLGVGVLVMAADVVNPVRIFG